MAKVPVSALSLPQQAMPIISPQQWQLLHNAMNFRSLVRQPSLIERDDLLSEWYVLDTERNTAPLVVPEHCLAIVNWPSNHPEGFLEWFRENGLSLALYKIGTLKGNYREASLFEFGSAADATLFKMRWL
jgi:hypothetical protein